MYVCFYGVQQELFSVNTLIKNVIVQGLGERKKKHAADKKKFEEELEELRSQQEVKCILVWFHQLS